MSRRTGWIVGFLAVTGLAVYLELVAALDHDPASVPLTDLLVELPWWVVLPAAVALSLWLPWHLYRRYQAKRTEASRFATASEEATMTGPLPVQPDPDGNHPSEPLAGVSLLVTAITTLVGAATAFGLPVTKAQGAALVAAVGALGALAVWLWGRRKVWSPASVATLLAAARAKRS